MKISRSQIAILVVVAVLSYLLGNHNGVKKQSWRSAVAAHHAAVDDCRVLGAEVNRRVKLAVRSQMTVVEFEEHFGKLVAVDQASFPDAGKGKTHVYTHAPSHQVFYLRFDDDTLFGHGWHLNDPQPHLPSIEQRLAAMK